MTLFHIAHRADWDEAMVHGEYSVASLAAEGFIHLSTRDQVLATAGRYYRGVTDLVLLEVDRAALDPVLLRFEPSTGGELFPHHYGALPVAAVVGVHTFAESPAGFDWPASLRAEG